MGRNGVAANPSAPIAMKLRVRYAKRGRGRFSSHRDVARAMEWALRRAGIPVALSHGFNPHPRLSWIGAAPTGAASEAEYLEVGVTEALDPAVAAAEIDRVLPEGLGVVDVVAVPAGATGPALADLVDASRWLIELPGVHPDALAEGVAALRAADAVEVERMTKNGPRTLDVRAPLVLVEVTPGGVPPSGSPEWAADAAPEDRQHPARSAVCGTLSAVVRHTTPAVRPDDVLSALRTVADLVPPVPAKATRLAQGRLDECGELLDPFEADRPVPGRESDLVRHAVEDRPV